MLMAQFKKVLDGEAGRPGVIRHEAGDPQERDVVAEANGRKSTPLQRFHQRRVGRAVNEKF